MDKKNRKRFIAVGVAIGVVAVVVAFFAMRMPASAFIGPVGAGGVGSGAISVGPTGNIGIGTTTPAFNLDIFGPGSANSFVGIRAQDSFTNSTNQPPLQMGILRDNGNSFSLPGIWMTGGTPTFTNANFLYDGNVTIFQTPTGKTMNFRVNNVTKMAMDTNGNVGIGTTAPTSTLTVAGEIKTTSGGVRFPDGTLQTTSGGGAQWTATSTGIFYNGGNVGIGTTSPTSPLNVVTPTQHLIPTVTITQNPGNPGCAGCTNQALQVNSLDALGSGKTNIGLQVNVGNAATDYAALFMGGNVGIGTPTPNDTLDVNGGLHVEGNVFPGVGAGLELLYNSASGTTNILSYNRTGAAWLPGTIDASTLALQANSGGKVGIGTAAPTSTLTVAGEIKTTLGGVRFPDGTLQTTTAAAGIYNDGGNIGIGTANAVAKLDIRGAQSTNYLNLSEGGNVSVASIVTDISNTPTFLLQNPSSLSQISLNPDGVSFFGVTAPGAKVGIGTASPSTFFQVVGTSTFIGNVGIGKTNPSTALDVNGTITGTTKNFEIPYPGLPGFDLVHSTLEGPENAVFYRGHGALVDGSAVVTLPSYFKDLTRPGSATVLLTAQGVAPYLLSYDNFSGNTFTVHGSIPSGSFDWQVEATRADVPLLQVMKPTPGK
jgi:hypothetical protein